MKKALLLSAAAVLGSFVMNAAPADYFKVLLEGNEIANGATEKIEVEKTETELPELNFTLVSITAGLDLNVVNVKSEAYTLKVVINGADGTSNDVVMSEGLGVCYANGGVNGSDNQCLMSSDPTTAYTSYAILPDKTLDEFEWQIHLNNLQETSKGAIEIALYACTGEGENAKIIEDSKFVMKVTYDATVVAAVEGIEAETAAPVYFDLQGRRVNNPEAGLYIVKRGNKVVKEFIR